MPACRYCGSRFALARRDKEGSRLIVRRRSLQHLAAISHLMDGFVSDYRAPINLARQRQRDFAGINGLFDFIVLEQLPWRVDFGEGDLDFLPNRVETVPRHCINDGNERLAYR